MEDCAELLMVVADSIVLLQLLASGLAQNLIYGIIKQKLFFSKSGTKSSLSNPCKLSPANAGTTNHRNIHIRKPPEISNSLQQIPDAGIIKNFL